MDGTKYHFDTRSFLEWSLWVYGGYESELLRTMMPMVGPGDVVLDCGANVGIHSCALARRVGAEGLVIAVEPMSELAARLRLNCELNRLENVTVVEKAVSSRQGKALLFPPHPGGPNQGQASLHVRSELANVAREVELETVDGLLCRQKVNDLRLIKLDVEGHEFQALKGASEAIRRWRPYLLFEFDPDAYRAAGVDWEQVYELLGSLRSYTLCLHGTEGKLEPVPRDGPRHQCMIVGIPAESRPEGLRNGARPNLQGVPRSGTAKSAQQMNVVLLRDVPEERRYSMERFADALQDGFAGNERFDVRGFTVHQHARASRLGLPALDRYFTQFLRYPLEAWRQRADLYHVVDQGYGHLAALLPPERTVVTCHDLMLLVGEDWLSAVRGRRTTVMRFRWSTSFLRKVARVVCVSAATQTDLINLCGVPEERTTVIANGIDPQFQPLAPSRSRQLKEELVARQAHAVLHVSSGVSYKNVPATLAVTAALRAEGCDVALVRVGVPLTGIERSLATRLGIDNIVIECGRVTDARLVELYNCCDVLLFPSHYEGFGWPPLEAMACGTPVVASNCAPLREVIGDAGLMADSEDIAGLARLVRDVLESAGTADALRVRGFERAAGFTWKRAVERYLSVYESVLECAG